MNNLVGMLFFIVFCMIMLAGCPKGCSSDESSSAPQITSYAADGLDLEAVATLFEHSKDLEQFERKLNNKSIGINNLDLDENGKTDFIQVEEFGNAQEKGVSLYTILGSNASTPDTQEIATIVFEQNQGRGSMGVHGNRNLYGNNHYYGSSFGLTDMLIMGYLFSNHGRYHSPYYYGHYPSYYGNGYPPRSKNSYRNRSASVKSRSTTTLKKSNAPSLSSKSPLAGKSSQKIKAPLKNPTSTQRAFQKRNPSKAIARGGFGRSGTNKTSGFRKSNTVRSGFRSGSRFGGGK